MTATRTYTVERYADPFIRCDECGKRAEGFVVDPHPDSEIDGANWPCGHKAAADTVCPSWSPVNGCQCEEHLGKVEHDPA